MFERFNKYKIDKYILENWTSRIVILLLVLIVMWQQMIIVNRISGQRTVFMPPVVVNKQFWVAGNTVSTSYLEMMSQFIIFNLFDVTPHNAIANGQNVLALVEPEFFADVEEMLSRQMSYLVDNQISRTFYFSKIDAKTPGRMVITGILKDLVSDKVIDRRDVNIEINYAINQGRFWMNGLKVIKLKGGK